MAVTRKAYAIFPSTEMAPNSCRPPTIDTSNCGTPRRAQSKPNSPTKRYPTVWPSIRTKTKKTSSYAAHQTKRYCATIRVVAKSYKSTIVIWAPWTRSHSLTETSGSSLRPTTRVSAPGNGTYPSTSSISPIRACIRCRLWHCLTMDATWPFSPWTIRSRSWSRTPTFAGRTRKCSGATWSLDMRVALTSRPTWTI